MPVPANRKTRFEHKKAFERVRRALESGFEPAGRSMAATINRNAPMGETLELSHSFIHHVGRRKGKPVLIVGVDATSDAADYALRQEMGYYGVDKAGRQVVNHQDGYGFVRRALGISRWGFRKFFR